jgi:HTH-type transcriptional regulator/antitoxin HigA
MATENQIHSDLAIPPGEYLEEVLSELGMSKDELAHRMGRPATKLSHIFKGTKSITPETALQLEKVVGVPAHVWTGLEAEYRLTLAHHQDQEQLQAEVELSRSFPYPDLAKNGEVKKTTSPTERVRELLGFFSVASLRNISGLPLYQAAFRCSKSTKEKRSEDAVNAWLRMGERRAQQVTTAAFDKSRLRQTVNEIRALTLLPVEDFQTPLREKLAACGVALVICPHFQGTLAYGATFWTARDRAALMITIRGKWADIFWFSLFHEIGHLLLHGKDQVILEDDDMTPMENEADDFAAEILIKSKLWQQFQQAGVFSEASIRAFARELGVHSGIVVGRLQHLNLIDFRWHNSLRSKYEWRETGKREQ